MKKINLSRKSKLLIGGIGSLAVLATIPAAVVACGASTTDSQATIRANIASQYAQIQSSYTLASNSAGNSLAFSQINQGNIANFIATSGISLPTLSSGLSYVYSNVSTAAAAATSFTFDVQITSGPYVGITSTATKTVTINLPSGTTGATAAALTTATLPAFTTLVTNLNNQSFAANNLGQSTLAATGTTPVLNSSITTSNFLTFTDLMPVINNTAITTTVSNLILGTNNTSISATLTFATTTPNITLTTTTATVTITGFMAPTATTAQINSVQENLNAYITGLTVKHNAFTLISTITGAPSTLVSSTATPTAGQTALGYASFLEGVTASAAGVALVTTFLPANILATNIVVTVSGNTTASSKTFTVTLQISNSTIAPIAISVTAAVANAAS